ncbi:MAG TPA: DUF998 domain-containing protein [Bradyrhizobium sp.]|uniref:DUF998 domain-containing protein n=1 Tax=Bradyrhizobium sp. TaxID=376 RepID=UPI002D80CE92|nr:DUF998 domain-containing protein [Bradyrhizobium sp.]HET7886544.1 DUF998 domain-containing protein [Bradyrhizobium sp.]
MDLNHVDEAIVESYRQLRTRIGFLAIAFPLVLLAAGRYWGINIQQTMSNYYFAEDPDAGMLDRYPVRLWFCGILFVVGFFLHKYHGFSKNEDRWLSVAGMFAGLVAIFPMSLNEKNDYDFLLAWTGLTKHISMHGICAALAFICIAIVIVVYADSTLAELRGEHPATYKLLKLVYACIAAFMVVSIGISIYLNIRYPQGDYILSAEWCGIWSFAAYWFVKNWELSQVGKVLKKRNAPLLRARSEADLADKL